MAYCDKWRQWLVTHAVLSHSLKRNWMGPLSYHRHELHINLSFYVLSVINDYWFQWILSNAGRYTDIDRAVMFLSLQTQQGKSINYSYLTPECDIIWKGTATMSLCHSNFVSWFGCSSPWYDPQLVRDIVVEYHGHITIEPRLRENEDQELTLRFQAISSSETEYIPLLPTGWTAYQVSINSGVICE